MNQLTLRKIPPSVEKKIRELSQERNQSINKTVIYLLKKALGLEKKERKYRDLGSISGSWTEKDAEMFMKHIDIFEHIDEEMWK